MCVHHLYFTARYSHLRHVRRIHNAAISCADPAGQLDPVDWLVKVVLKMLVEQLLPHALIGIEICKKSTCLQNKIKGVWWRLDAGSICLKLAKYSVHQLKWGALQFVHRLLKLERTATYFVLKSCVQFEAHQFVSLSQTYTMWFYPQMGLMKGTMSSTSPWQ